MLLDEGEPHLGTSAKMPMAFLRVALHPRAVDFTFERLALITLVRDPGSGLIRRVLPVQECPLDRGLGVDRYGVEQRRRAVLRVDQEHDLRAA